MKRKFIWLLMSYLMVAALVLASCRAPVVEKPEVEAVEKEPEVGEKVEEVLEEKIRPFPGPLFQSTPGNIYFPQLKPGERVFMEAELIGELVVVNSCIRVNSREGDTSYLVIWPPEFTLATENDLVQIRNEVGEVVARIGEEVYMTGGERPANTAWLSQQLREKLPDTCPEPYWVVGEQVRLFESEP